jgi:hypothetical protein
MAFPLLNNVAMAPLGLDDAPSCWLTRAVKAIAGTHCVSGHRPEIGLRVLDDTALAISATVNVHAKQGLRAWSVAAQSSASSSKSNGGVKPV